MGKFPKWENADYFRRQGSQRKKPLPREGNRGPTRDSRDDSVWDWCARMMSLCEWKLAN